MRNIYSHTKPKVWRSRYEVVREFDWLTAGRTYDFSRASNSSYIDVRRIDGSGIGTYLRSWQFAQAIANDWIRKVEGN